MVPFPEAGRGRCRLLAFILATMASIWVPCGYLSSLPDPDAPVPSSSRGYSVRVPPASTTAASTSSLDCSNAVTSPSAETRRTRWLKDGVSLRTALAVPSTNAAGRGLEQPQAPPTELAIGCRSLAYRQVANRAALTRQSPRRFEDYCREPS